MRAFKPFLLLLWLLSGSAWALPGDVDPTFVYPTPAFLEPDSTDVVPMSVGWMVVKSHLPAALSISSTVALTRIDDDGRLIASFGTGGQVVTQLPGPFNVSLAAASTGDGGLVVAGYKRLNDTGDTVAAVVKLTAQGQVDTTFADGGIIEFDSPFALDRVGAIQALEDGRIAVLVWSRVTDNRPYDCSTDRMVLWYLSADGHERNEVHAVARDGIGGGSCRTALTLEVGPDNRGSYRVLYGSEVGVFEGSVPVVPLNWRWGPFAFQESVPAFFSQIEGPWIALAGGPALPDLWRVPESNLDLAQAVGFSDRITWNGMAIDPAANANYVGMSTDGGRVAIARFRWSGEIDTGWADGYGITALDDTGSTGVMAFEGIANDVRMLDLRDEGLVVATSDGVIRRLLRGSAESNGAFVLSALQAVVNRGPGGVQVVVQRIGSVKGAVSVRYSVHEPDCSRSQCSEHWASAKADEDFVAASGTLHWTDGEGADKSFSVSLPPVSATQPNELLVVELSDATGGARILSDWRHVFLGESTSSVPPKLPEDSKPDAGGGAIDRWQALLLLLLATGMALRDRLRADGG
jgi:hypothetical protein